MSEVAKTIDTMLVLSRLQNYRVLESNNSSQSICIETYKHIIFIVNKGDDLIITVTGSVDNVSYGVNKQVYDTEEEKMKGLKKILEML